jgi:hypothetical protein
VRAPVITLATAVSEDAHRFEGAYASGVSIFGVAHSPSRGCRGL